MTQLEIIGLYEAIIYRIALISYTDIEYINILHTIKLLKIYIL